MTDATPTSPPCPLWRRLLALVYDLLAVLAIVMAVGLICEVATHGQLIVSGRHTLIAWWYQPLQALVVGTYFVASWLRGGQTLGMRPWHIRVTSRDGGRLAWRQALLRLLVAALPLLLLETHAWLGLRGAVWAVLAAWVVWFAVALVDPRRRALHDIAAGTEIRRFG
jgi:uncharacterized RDD family membrane protein YckC